MHLSEEEQKLVEKLKRVEALFARTPYEGERAAAAEALKRLAEQLASYQQKEQPTEHQFTLPDPWKRKLFMALLRRHGLRPYRYPRQRYSTVMAKAPRGFVEQVLWPEFLELAGILEAYLNQVTERVISEGIHSDASEADVVHEVPPKQLP